MKNNFKESIKLIPKDNFNSFVNNYFKDNFSAKNEKFNFNYDIGKIFENNIKDSSDLLKKKIDDVKNFNFEDALDEKIIEELKINLREKKDITNIFNEIKNKSIGNINDNFNKIDISSINFNFNKDKLFKPIYDFIEKANPFNTEKIKSLEQNLIKGFDQIEENNLLEQPKNLLNLLKVNLNSNNMLGKTELGGNKFSFNDCKKICRILME